MSPKKILKRLPKNGWTLSLILHCAIAGLLLSVLFRADSIPPPRGSVSVMTIEIGGEVGAGSRPEIHRPQPRARPPSATDGIATAPSAKSGERKSDADVASSIASGVSDRGTGEGGGNKTELAIYVAEVVRLINQKKQYPRSALLREEEGKVMISIDVAPDGTVSNPVIEKPSPFESLNQGAIATILAMPKLPPVPASLPQGAHLHIPILYRIDR